MTDHDGLLILLTSRSHSRHQTVYHGISLSGPEPKLDAGRRVWVHGQSAVEVEFAFHQITTRRFSDTPRGCAYEEDGNFTFEDEPQKWRKSMPSCITEPVNYLKFRDSVEIPLPAFVSDRRDLHPAATNLVVNLCVSSVGELGEARAELDSLQDTSLNHSPRAQARKQLLATSPSSGMVIPVEYISRGHPDVGVLLLSELRPDGCFRAILYHTDTAATIDMNTILSRWPRRMIRIYEWQKPYDLARVVSVLGSGPFTVEVPGTGIVGACEDGAKFPIECSACGSIVPAAAFDREQLSIIDLWSWYYPWLDEQTRLLEIPDLQDAEKSTTHPLFRRSRFVNERIAFYEPLIRDRCVICPNCGAGVLRLGDGPRVPKSALAKPITQTPSSGHRRS